MGQDSSVKDFYLEKIWSSRAYELSTSKQKTPGLVFTKKVVNNHVATSPQYGILYRGIGMVLDPENKFAFPILQGESSTMTVEKDG